MGEAAGDPWQVSDRRCCRIGLCEKRRLAGNDHIRACFHRLPQHLKRRERCSDDSSHERFRIAGLERVQSLCAPFAPRFFFTLSTICCAVIAPPTDRAAPASGIAAIPVAVSATNWLCCINFFGYNL